MTTRTVIGISILTALTLALGTTALADPGLLPLQAAHFDGRSPDTKDAAFAAHHNSRSVSGVALAHTTPPDGTSFDGRSPDTKDAAYAVHHRDRSVQNSTNETAGPPMNGVGYDGRSPDTRDAAAIAHAGGLNRR